MEAKKPYLRHERVSELIRKELGEIIIREMEFPNTLVTIIEVDVTDKLDYARIHISAIPSERAEVAVKQLNARVPYLQHLLLKKINLKPMPTLQFEVDMGLDKAARIEKALLEHPADEQKSS